MLSFLHLCVDVLQGGQTPLLLSDIGGCPDLSYLDFARQLEPRHLEVAVFFANLFSDCMCDKLFPPYFSLAFENGGCLR